jgi:hypothetical protein
MDTCGNSSLIKSGPYYQRVFIQLIESAAKVLLVQLPFCVTMLLKPQDPEITAVEVKRPNCAPPWLLHWRRRAWKGLRLDNLLSAAIVISEPRVV